MHMRRKALMTGTDWRSALERLKGAVARVPAEWRRVLFGLACSASILALLAFPGGEGKSAEKALPAAAFDAPALSFADFKMQQSVGAAYNDALKNLLEINTIRYSAKYDRTGWLSDPPGTFIRAGGGYDQPWTRDASVNSWNAASLLEPDAARNTLWAVVERQADGKPIVQQDNQWWDQSIWAIAAWNHFLVTGDRGFLAKAYDTARNTLTVLRRNHYKENFGLFEGPSFFNDGIAGYPAPPADEAEDHGTFVLDYHGTDKLMALSTNCIYYEAYRSIAQMGTALRRPAAETAQFNRMADALKSAINRRFWNPRTGLYGYLIVDGALDAFQEGSGLSFAILFDIADAAKAQSILNNTHVQPYGIVDVYPNFPRFSDAQPGRHNGMVWPMVEGFWAEAAARRGDEKAFAREVTNLAGLDRSGDGHFFELYNAETGAPDGGWQAGGHMKSQPDQTWSATAYLRMIYGGLFGMRYSTKGIEFHPLLPAGWGDVTLSDLHYRKAILTIRLRGAGSVIRSLTLDGVPQRRAFVAAGLTGKHTLYMLMAQEGLSVSAK